MGSAKGIGGFALPETRTPPRPPSEDTELQAIQCVRDALVRLEHREEVERVMDWAVARFLGTDYQIVRPRPVAF